MFSWPSICSRKDKVLYSSNTKDSWQLTWNWLKKKNLKQAWNSYLRWLLASKCLSFILQVYSLLEKATQNRAVAATQCNERSSRSHSVFRLKLTGENHLTAEKCQGIEFIKPICQPLSIFCFTLLPCKDFVPFSFSWLFLHCNLVSISRVQAA